MKIHPRHYPTIILAAFVVFLLLGLLLGFSPERGGEGGGRGFLFLLEAVA
ncbi:MAG: hypothetical protein FD146_2335 [Anaerolineaceae bacterium]|nr:MAG: hypothetical protein FD146_2335 [Anaerolineaceae bacterium]